MARPIPFLVMTLMANTDTSVTVVMARTRLKAPTTATPPTRVGITAAAMLPKIRKLKMNTNGSEIVSARVMSTLTWELTSS